MRPWLKGTSLTALGHNIGRPSRSALLWLTSADARERFLMSFPDTASQNGSLDSMQDLSAGRIRRALSAVRQLGPLRLLALIRQQGARKSIAFAANNIRHMIAHRLALRWDREHGVDTAGSIQLHSLTVSGPNRNYGNEAVCTSPKTFDFMMQSLPRDLSGFTFVDIGSGKSRTLLLASRYCFAQIIGVEFAKELAACARRNIASFRCTRQRCRDLSLVEADATQFTFPEAPLVLYFYNPFAQNVFDVVLGNLTASLKARQRNCYILYGSSSHNAIGWAKPAILATGMFEEITAPPMPLFLDAVRTVNYAVFRARGQEFGNAR